MSTVDPPNNAAVAGTPTRAMDAVLPDSDATDALGAALAHAYDALRGRAVLHLEGELGAGKTSCVRSLLRSLGVAGLIRSPTYTLVETYLVLGITCVHVDLYRVHSPLEVEELGLRDLADCDLLLLVEWPDRGGTALPAADLMLQLSYQGAGRQARLVARTAHGIRWLDYLLDDTRLNSYVSNLT